MLKASSDFLFKWKMMKQNTTKSNMDMIDTVVLAKSLVSSR